MFWGLNIKEELLKGLTEEQIAKVKACKNQEEMLAVAKEEGIELTDEQLEAVSRGACTAPKIPCPRCGSNSSIVFDDGRVYNDCGCYWRTDDKNLAEKA